MLIRALKRYIPVSWMRAYHFILAKSAAFLYGNPSEKMIVIGVTGTKGKTTTTYLIAKALEASGAKVGCTSTALYKIGDQEWINTTSMTMLGRFALQRLLHQMVSAGCRYAVIETSSQGLIQSRHIGINYDVAVFTNLYPEHLEAHGGFEAYKLAKQRLFTHLAKSTTKTIDGKVVSKAAVINADSPHASFYAETPGLPSIVWFGIQDHRGLTVSDVELTERGSSFHVGHTAVTLQIPGAVNMENALAALAVCQTLGIPLQAASQRLSEVRTIPGRFERIEEGQPWTVIVDYAHEAESLKRLYEALSSLPRQRTIHVLGAASGGRDVAKRPLLGLFVGQQADVVIVTNEDPFDEDPHAIIEQVAEGARQAGKQEGTSLYLIDDRREAIQYAMNMARPGDLVLLTGKGSETTIRVAQGKTIPWQEAAEARRAIAQTKDRAH
ncbi:MAG: UDP-N-acetylmuramyl-tripeptide synthetase [Patescibacteria group bacterium]